VQNALVATPDPAGSQAFGPSGIGLVARQFGIASFVKLVAQAWFRYVVSINFFPGDLVLTGANGGPLNLGNAAIKAFSFTPIRPACT
jgi:hypothetical protein